MKRLKGFKIQLFCKTDAYEAYQSIIPAHRHAIGKDKTHAIERNNCRQRHWFARFKRKSIVVSKSIEMVDLTMRIFASLIVNKTLKLDEGIAILS